MNALTFFFLCFYTSSALLPEYLVEEEWNKFKAMHARAFFDPLEESLRKSIFIKNLEIVEEHNEKYQNGSETYEMGINKFSDFTEEELTNLTGLQLPLEIEQPLINITEESLFFSLGRSLPASFDWRQRGGVTPVKNQGQCGSCWAFATLGAIESHYKIRFKRTVSLSEQQLVDCVGRGGGCGGGWMPTAYSYIARNKGVNYNRDYRYQARNGKCRYSSSKPHITIRGYAAINNNQNEEAVRKMVATKGPVSVAIHVDTRTFNSYKSGVYNNPSCRGVLNHAVVIVGYGRERGLDYWLVKNSWGSTWGQGGYIKMARNRRNQCGIATHASYPVF
ncbi:procathepsin L-like [Tribolium madens]|uniref:procathepsin L-like n=1 Tax=Tribolium madens TaxID=41895 RepID=UPI001CF73DB1|nr:procathepsin L-like [Tribolium madens]XP_044265940.1 procathepsin L-like [Tribolium madens]